VALFRTLGIVELLIMSSKSAKYGIMASLPSVRISPGTPSGPTNFFLSYAASLLLIIIMLMVKGSPE
jgi:hypothetical protein